MSDSKTKRKATKKGEEGGATSRLEQELQSMAIKVTSQESRFHSEAIVTSTKEIDLKDVNLHVGQKQLLQDAHLRLKEGVHYGLVGRNGTGKSTLLRALSDRLIPGLPTNVKILLVSQLDSEQTLHDLTRSHRGKEIITVMDAVLHGDRKRVEAEREVEELGKALDSQDATHIHRIASNILLERAFEGLVDARKISSKRSGARGATARKDLIEAEKRYELAKEETTDEGQRDWMQEASTLHTNAVCLLEDVDAATVTSRAHSILAGLGFSRKQIEEPYTNLSGGWKARVALASALLQHNDILVLDEPINYLDMPTILWLEQFVRNSSNTVVTVAHDVEFLNAVTEELIVLKREKLTYFNGNLVEYERQVRKKLKHARRLQEGLDKKKEAIEKSISDGKKQAKKTGDENRQRMIKSREKKLQDRWGVEANAAGHRFKLNRDFGGYHLTSRDEIEMEEADKSIHFSFPDPVPLRFTGSLLHLENVSFAYPATKRLIFKNINLTMELGDRVALVGPNGHGKTTLLELITGSGTPTTGTITLHPRLKLAYYAQEALTNATFQASTQTPLQHFLDHAQSVQFKTEQTARAFLSQFDLKGRSVDAIPVAKLSGGQRVKLILAEIMCSGPDLVIFDEVTTHLDSDSISALITALRRFTGAVLLISHDRQAIKEIIEGKKVALATSDDEDSSSESTEDDETSEQRVGRTYLLKDGRMRLLAKGVERYVAAVEKELAK